MAYLFASNNVAHWSGAVTTGTTASYYDSTRVPYYLEMTDDSGGVSLKSLHPETSTTTTWYHFRYYASSTSGPAEDGYLCSIKDGNGKYLARVELNNGALTMAVSGNGVTFTNGTYSGTVGTSLTEFDIKVSVTATDVDAELYINQVLHVSGNMNALNSGSLGVARTIDFDLVDATSSIQKHRVSEFLVSETDTRNARVNLLQGTGAGNHTDWTGTVAELFDSDSSTGMTSDTDGNRESLTIDTYTGGTTIDAVLGVAYVARGAAGPANGQVFVRKSSTDYDGSSQSVELTSPGFVVEEWSVDPSDSGSWTSSDLSGLEVGFESLT